LEAAGRRDIIVRPGRTIDNATTFELEKRRGRLTPNAMAPYFYGALEADPDTGGTAIVGHFGFHPDARAGAVIIAIIAVLALGPSLYEGGWEDLEGGALVFAIGMAGLILTRWTRRGDKREITKFLASTLDAGSP